MSVNDRDRLDAAFAELERRGVIALQRAGGSNSMGLDDVEDEQKYRIHLGRPARGFCFYHSQDLESAIAGDGLYLSFGAFSGAVVTIGILVVDTLQSVGLKPKWNGDARERIFVKMRWSGAAPKLWVPKGRPYPFQLPGEAERVELRAAALHGDLDTVSRLLREGVDPNDDENETALHKAAFRGHLEIVQVLLAAGARRDAISGYGETAWQIALRRGHAEVARLLRL
jgi:hypothetical protein